MSNNTFSGLEMLKIAMLMEEEGYNLYKTGAENTSGKTKEFLLAASGQEFHHKEKFAKLYNELAASKEDESEYLYDDQVSGYLRAMIENQVFNKNEDLTDAFKDLKSAAKKSLETEELTVKVYTEMYKGVTGEAEKEIMARIIEEEKQHVEYFRNLLGEIE
ncbi:MAG TPA: rubrerythrin family protein [Clostridiales bacterium]|nr:rubrerythrin family protein [Clostridiales bacterium]